MVIFLSECVEGILQLFTNFYLQRKFSIFLRNDRDCKVVDPYNARKRYTVTESLDLMRNTPWKARDNIVQMQKQFTTEKLNVQLQNT
jgi:hypothetical protein